jgi:hypothetical protein
MSLPHRSLLVVHDIARRFERQLRCWRRGYPWLNGMVSSLSDGTRALARDYVFAIMCLLTS